eukprot:COSAG01_NODE_17204_length_1170_cov_1.577031_2_plen_95_part_01
MSHAAPAPRPEGRREADRQARRQARTACVALGLELEVHDDLAAWYGGGTVRRQAVSMAVSTAPTSARSSAPTAHTLHTAQARRDAEAEERRRTVP